MTYVVSRLEYNDHVLHCNDGKHIFRGISFIPPFAVVVTKVENMIYDYTFFLQSKKKIRKVFGKFGMSL
jgi:hypothetical protein